MNSNELIDTQLRRVSNLFKKYSKFPDGDFVSRWQLTLQKKCADYYIPEILTT
jgi:hypothetical protein